jgi:hypothetical protein
MFASLDAENTGNMARGIRPYTFGMQPTAFGRG